MKTSFPPDVLQAAAHWCTRITSEPLEADEQRDLEAWLRADACHPEALKSALGVWETFDMDSFPSEIELMRTTAMADLRRSQARLNGWRKGLKSPVAAVAASVAIVVSGVLAFGLLTPVAHETYTTQIAERRTVVLEDGSELTLDSESEVEVRFNDDMRQLRLTRGRANFEVAKNPMRPFFVEVGDRTVVATGTEFTVEKLSSQLKVVLYEGQVSVMASKSATVGNSTHVAGGTNYIEATLDPGQTYILSSNTKQPLIVAMGQGDKNEWQNGVLVFENEPLPLAVERVNRYSKLKISLDGTKLRHIRISGIYKADDTEAFLDGLVAIHGLRFKKAPSGYLVF